MKPTRPKPAKKKEKEVFKVHSCLSSLDFTHQLSLFYKEGSVEKAKKLIESQHILSSVFAQNNVEGWMRKRTHAKKDDPKFLPFAKQVVPSLPEYDQLFGKVSQDCVRKNKPKMLMSLYPTPEKGIPLLSSLLKETLFTFTQGAENKKEILSFLCQQSIIQNSHVDHSEKPALFQGVLVVLRANPSLIPAPALEVLLGMVSVRQALHILLRDKKDHIPQNLHPFTQSLSQVYLCHLNKGQQEEAFHYMKTQPEFEKLLEYIPHLLNHHIKEEVGKEEPYSPTKKRKI